MSENRRRPSRIPEFSSVQEEAEFWDTHDFTDFLDELEPVKVTFGPARKPPLSVRLDARDRAEVDRRAQEQGIGASTLVRMWIRERIRAESGA